MPANEQTILNLQIELNNLTNAIYDTSLDLSETTAAHVEANEEIESSRTAKLAVVLNDRFEINNKLVYTNDDQRKVAVAELENADIDLQTMKTVRLNLTATKAEQNAAVERDQNLYKAKLLVLQYYANLP